jgi:hypothetical protein
MNARGLPTEQEWKARAQDDNAKAQDCNPMQDHKSANNARAQGHNI